ncbi:MAG: PQQ-dependent sugar dehydrogenase [Verrucomicrobiota bacterium]
MPHTVLRRALLLGSALAFSSAAVAIERVAATGLKLPAEAPSFSYKTEPAFGGVKFIAPVGIVFAPNETHRAFVTELPGFISVVRDFDNPKREVVLDLTAKVGNDPEHGLLSFAFHPQFATNGYLYAWYSVTEAGVRYNRLARFHVPDIASGVVEPASETPLISQRMEPGLTDDGGTVAFGSDGYLYLSIGDGSEEGSESAANRQRIDRGFLGGIIRIDVDRRAGNRTPNAHPAVHAGTYLIPADNPFVGATSFNGLPVAPAAVRSEFWAIGLRNPFRFSFDLANLWLADVGLNTREEINHIVKGGNYGWPHREASLAGPLANPPAGATFTNPIFEYGRDTGGTIIGGLVYRGHRFIELHGTYLFGDFTSGRIFSLTDNAARPLPSTQLKQIATEGGVVGFAVDPRQGDILLADLDDGMIKRLATVATDATALPATLADTGAFTNVAQLTAAPGLVGYEPNVTFWSDHAKKRRWFALRDTTSKYGFNAAEHWTLPTGAVWVKHFDLELERGNPGSARRIETRFIVKTANDVYGITYRWNAEQTNATLVPEEGADETFMVRENGVTRPQTWRYPSRGECLSCHTPTGGYALSFNTAQLNRSFPNDPDNQLAALAAAGYLSMPTVPAPATLPKLAAPDDISQSLETRARSYLETNCAQCHSPGGRAPRSWIARSATPLDASGLVNGTVGNVFGDAANRTFAAGDPAHSMIINRITRSDTFRMPPVGRREVDPVGSELLRAYAYSLRAPASHLVNLSARTEPGAGENVAIAGFVVTAAQKPVLLRAVGPSLADVGVSGPLPSTTLTLYRGNQLVAENTGWTTWPAPDALRTTAARVGAFALRAGSADSAVLVTLAPGAYTAVARSPAATATGLALVEAYDAEVGAPGGLITHTSLRGRVGAGDRALIAGFQVAGPGPRSVLVRAIGPALRTFGVAEPLAAPTLRVMQGNTVLGTNTGWSTANNVAEIRTASTQLGAFALSEGSADSALVLTLPPGSYSLQIGSATAATGIALAEVFILP